MGSRKKKTLVDKVEKKEINSAGLTSKTKNDGSHLKSKNSITDNLLPPVQWGKNKFERQKSNVKMSNIENLNKFVILQNIKRKYKESSVENNEESESFFIAADCEVHFPRILSYKIRLTTFTWRAFWYQALPWKALSSFLLRSRWLPALRKKASTFQRSTLPLKSTTKWKKKAK